MASAAFAGPPIVHVPAPRGTPPVRHGYELYSANCARCHGIAGHGKDRQGPPLRGVGALAADFYLRTGYMPLDDPEEQPWRTRVLFSEREVRALVAYVGSLGRGPPVPHPDPSRGDLSEGLSLFTDHCAGCHQVAAAGGYVTGARVPPLTHASAVQIAEAVRQGPYLMPAFSKRQITDRQLDSIVRYIEYVKEPDDRGGWSLGHVGPVPEGLVTWLLAGTVLVTLCYLIGRRIER